MFKYGTSEWFTALEDAIPTTAQEEAAFAVRIAVARGQDTRSCVWTFSDTDLVSVTPEASPGLRIFTILSTPAGAETLFGLSDVNQASGASPIENFLLVDNEADERRRVPPYDEIDNPLFEELTEIPGADISVNCDFLDSPFGSIRYGITFVDGKRKTTVAGLLPDAGVTLRLRYDLFLRHRLGELNMLQALEDGGVTGDVPMISALSGIVNSPEYQSAWKSSFSATDLLAKWSAIIRSPGYAPVAEWVAANTNP